MRNILTVGLIALSSSAFAQSLDDKQRKDTLGEIERLKGQVFANVDNMVRKKQNECMSAFPNQRFCECIATNTSVGINFATYIAIVTRTKEELKYETRSSGDKETIDINRAAREKCAAAASNPANQTR